MEKLAESKTEMPKIWPEEARELFIELLMSGPEAVSIIEDLDQALNASGKTKLKAVS